MLHSCDIESWVNNSPDKQQRQFREAVHVILLAIATSPPLSVQMIMKGAVLLAVRYDSTRFTRDIDFSTSMKLAEFNKEAFLADLENSMIGASDILEYGMDCRVQSHTIRPAREDATFPTLMLKIGYAHLADKKSHQRLMKKQASQVVKIDYSFNEITQEIDSLEISATDTLSVYSFSDLVAEKYRAILQQAVRNRFRRQDAYDLYYLFQNHQPLSDKEKIHILESLKIKSESRNLLIQKNSMADPEIIERSRKEYHTLQDEIETTLPDFDLVYSTVRTVYESLPWSDS